MLKKLDNFQKIGTGIITVANISDGISVDVWYSPSELIEFTDNATRIGDILTPSWHPAPQLEGDIYMIQRVGGASEPWGQVIRLEGIPGTSYKMRGMWKAQETYKGDSIAGVTPVQLSGDIDLVIYEGSTFACIKTHTATGDAAADKLNGMIPPSKKEINEILDNRSAADKEADIVPEIRTTYWLLTQMAGMQGPVGQPGPSLIQGYAYTAVLTNENHTFPADADKVLFQGAQYATNSEIQIFRGAKNITNDPNETNLKVSISLVEQSKYFNVEVNNETKSIRITPKFTEPLDTIQGTLKFQVHVQDLYTLEYTDKDLKQEMKVDTVITKEFSWSALISAQDPYTLNILSTNGLIFPSGSVNTVLIATVSRGTEDVTLQLTPDMRWYKTSSGGKKELVAQAKSQLEITPSDVTGQQTYSCEVEI